VYRLLRIFHNFSPFGITDFTAFAVLQGVRGSLLQLHALRLATAAKSAIADFRWNAILMRNRISFWKNRKVDHESEK
jgi:hypothetical protein